MMHRSFRLARWLLLLSAQLWTGLAGIGMPASSPCRAASRAVTAFGALPNGGRDCAAAIQSAIDASAVGDTVRLPSGTLLVNHTIRPKTGVKIAGCGREHTILKCQAEKPFDVFDLSGMRNVELSHFAIDGGDNAGARCGISAVGGGGHRIHDLKIHNLGAPGALGIHFGGRDTNYDHGVCDCLIADNVISNISLDSAWGGGIRLSWGSSRNRVLRNAIDNTGRGGIFADNGSADLTICHNRVTRSGRKAEKLGLEIWKDCDRVVIEDNTIDHWLSVGGAARVAVRRNTISEKSGDVGFLGLELIGQDVVATDNLVDDGQQIGISVSNDAHNEYQYCAHNTVRNMVQWAVQVQGDKAGARMLYYYKNAFLITQRGNPAAIYPHAAGRGFRFNGNCHFVTLDANEILDNRAEGIELGGGRLDGISIVNNVIRGNAMAAVCGRAGADFEWAGNTVAGNGSNRPFASHGSLGPKPAASFRCSSSPTVGQTVNFTNTSAAAAGGLGHVLWDFGDGVPSTSFHGSHTYGRAGTYRVTLVVWDKAGRGAMKKQSITVLRGSPAGGETTPGHPGASYRADTGGRR